MACALRGTLRGLPEEGLQAGPRGGEAVLGFRVSESYQAMLEEVPIDRRAPSEQSLPSPISAKLGPFVSKPYTLNPKP